MKSAVLMPGWATDCRIFSGLYIGYDGILPSNIDPDSIIPEIIETLDRKKIEKAHVVGWSLGGNIAAEFASKYPERVGKLVLISVRSSYTKEGIEKVKQYISENKKAYLYKFYLECFSKNEKEELKWFKDNLMKEYFGLFPQETLFKGLDMLVNMPVIPEKLKGIDVSFIFGKMDRIVTVEEVVKLKNMFPSSRFMFSEGAGHIPFLKDKGQLVGQCLDDYKGN